MINKEALNHAIKTSGVKKCVIAQVLGITPNALTRKLNGSVEFKSSEVVKMRDFLHLSNEDVERIFLLSSVNNIHTQDKPNGNAD